MRSYRRSWYDNEFWNWSASSDRNADVLFTQIYMNTNTVLTHLPLELHICISESGQQCFRQLLVAYSAPSHYLKQCWVIVNWNLSMLRNNLQWNFNQNTVLFIHENASENIVCKMVAILSRGRWVNRNPTIHKSYYDIIQYNTSFHIAYSTQKELMTSCYKAQKAGNPNLVLINEPWTWRCKYIPVPL